MTTAEKMRARKRVEEVRLADDLVVKVRGLSLGGKLKYQSRLTSVDSKGNLVMRDEADYGAAAADVLIECVLEMDGVSPVFADVADIVAMDGDDAAALFEKARELSGLAAGSAEAIEKNS